MNSARPSKPRQVSNSVGSRNLQRGGIVLRSLFAVVLLGLYGAGLVAACAWAWIQAPVLVHPPKVVEIQPGMTPRAIAGTLHEQGIIRNTDALLALARFNGSDTRIRHGRHEFGGWVTAEATLEELVTVPQRASLRITIPEGYTFRQIAELLEAKEIASAEDYIRAACDPELIRLARASEGANCTEGYMFPDTYDLLPGTTAEQITHMQLRRFEEVARPLLDRSRPANRPESDWANHVLTLASIVEKETGRGFERGLVSAVMHNRLKLGMKLQTDPTVIYGVIHSGENWDGNITRRHLREHTPYNTYAIAGMPPGPIANVGVAAIEAALNPEESEFLYFVARGDGTHKFSRTYAEHSRAVREFQLKSSR